MSHHEPTAPVAIVTGGTGAIGSAIAAWLQDSGMQVVAADRDAQAVPAGQHFVACEMTDPASIAALFVIQFIYGWNQYLWPLLVTTNEDMYPVVMGIKRLISAGEAYTEWNVVMANALLAMIPPAIVVILMQKWFVKGLVDSEK